MSELKNQKCPICGKNGLNLKEEEIDIPNFGKTYVLSMICDLCKYRKIDLEAAERKEPVRYTFEIESEADLNVKIVKSGEATVKIPHIITIEPGAVSEGYITNLEGFLEKVRTAIQSSMDEEDEEAVKKGKSMLKKIDGVTLGREKLKIILEDPSGNSAIISDKAKKEKL